MVALDCWNWIACWLYTLISPVCGQFWFWWYWTGGGQFWLETDKAAYLLRQHFFNNLHDRLSTRPFLSLVEKKWLAFQVFVQLVLICVYVHLGWDWLITVTSQFSPFQLLCAVKQSHEHGICHGKWLNYGNISWLFVLLKLHCVYNWCTLSHFEGDIKCENVLVTSWNWVYLADFASFKPTYIPDDDPSDFSFFFDTGGRRLCYLAPEVGFCC